ncbi:hypothetical protein [Bordetella hinzii]|uniref:hypothetical protein n=1 Tax=Bordetella hinzii TaxID=103855 RepID=UPI0039FBA30F
MAAKQFHERPLAECELSSEERTRWLAVLDQLLKYAGSPGDWGYESKLGRLTLVARDLRRDIANGDR